MNPNAALERNHVDERSRRYPETELYPLALATRELRHGVEGVAQER
jgi:hypothetical protein